MSKHYKFETLQLHVGQENADPTTDSRAVPIYATTSYVFKDSAQAAGRFALTEPGNIYTRLMNPTSDVFEKRVAALEGGIGALATASGSAAIAYAIQNIAKAGDHIVSSTNLYGGTTNLFENTLPEQGITTTLVDPSNPENFEKAIQPKFMGGHGTVMGGIVVDGGKFDWAQNDKFPGLSQPNPSYHGVVFTDVCGNAAYITKLRTTLMRDLGATISPFNSFLLLQGLETLSLRVERHVENALKVVDFLKKHPQVEKVNHPSLATGHQKELYDRYFPNGAGSIFTFEIKGDVNTAKKFTESLELFSLLANVADVKSLVIHPASTTHSQLDEEGLLACGIKPTTIRLSIGTEHIDDIIDDLKHGFEAVK